MCRLLAVKSIAPFDTHDHLERFAQAARRSREYQGHGWGLALLDERRAWRLHHSISPIWTDRLDRFGRTTLLLAHARSAFRNEGIAVENNMPFLSGRHVFIFNGELQGVRIREEGRIGAEKIFNFIRRFDTDPPPRALERGVQAIRRRTRHIRAMNIIQSDGESLLVSSEFSEDPEYFTMHTAFTTTGAPSGSPTRWLCSEPLPGVSGWRPIETGSVQVFL